MVLSEEFKETLRSAVKEALGAMKCERCQENEPMVCEFCLSDDKEEAYAQGLRDGEGVES